MSQAQTHNDNTTWFLLGREPLLSAAELFSLLQKPENDFDYAPPFLFVKGQIDKEIINKLGGTIKIAVGLGNGLNEEQLLNKISATASEQTGKIVFGISFYGPGPGRSSVEDWGKNIKKTLKANGRSVRYVYNKEPELSSVTVEKNGLTKNGSEFLVIQNKSGFSVAKTAAVQPFEGFNQRDFGRPGRDSFSGMLPPKLALMMINLACPVVTDVLLDPFCGSGTVLSESILLGIKKVIGYDLSEKAISDSNENINWLRNVNPGLSSFEITTRVCDVKKISTDLPPKSVDVIVTEPYLGKPLRGNEPESEIKKQADELFDLYRTAFGEFKKIIRPKGRIIFIIPQFISRSTNFIISDRLLLEAQKLGFKTEALLPNKISAAKFILYRRADQRVGREIWKFTLS